MNEAAFRTENTDLCFPAAPSGGGGAQKDRRPSTLASLQAPAPPCSKGGPSPDPPCFQEGNPPNPPYQGGNSSRPLKAWGEEPKQPASLAERKAAFRRLSASGPSALASPGPAKSKIQSAKRAKRTAQERRNLWEAFRRVSLFSDYKDLLLLKEKAFADLLNVDGVRLSVRPGPFIDPQISASGSESSAEKAASGFFETPPDSADPNSSKARLESGGSNSVKPFIARRAQAQGPPPPKTSNESFAQLIDNGEEATASTAPAGAQTSARVFQAPLEHAGRDFGFLTFYSYKLFSAGKKKRLQSFAEASAAALYFIETKIKQKNLKRQWNGAFDSFYRALCITDEKFKIIRANRAFSRLTGLSKKELFRRAAFHCLHVPEKDLAPSGFTLSRTINNRRLEIRSSRLILEEDRFILLMASDVTEESRLQEQLSLKARERELGFIRGSIAHELNSPLTGMSALLHLIETEPSSALMPKETQKKIRTALDRCETLVKTILQASKEPV